MDGILYPDPYVVVWAGVWSLAAILVIALVLLAQVFRAGPVNSYRVQGAIAVYLLFGAGWAHAYHLTAILHPGSFNAPSGNMSTPLDWTYFSFVTLSTLGYGDITPVQPIARVLAAGRGLGRAALPGGADCAAGGHGGGKLAGENQSKFAVNNSTILEENKC